jgi:predicted AAA+ superfamily ATPase
MTQSNHDRVGKALTLLNSGLQPFVEREMQAKYGARWRYEALNSLREQHISKDGTDLNLDTQGLLLILWDQWQPVFRNVLGQAERSLVSELRNVRNEWAHQNPFSLDDAYRALDSMQRLLSAVSAAEQADEIERQRLELLRQKFEDQARNKTRKISGPLHNGSNTSGLPPWREVITPQPDVASGTYQIAEFAADLGRVYKGEGSDEYRKPRDFFQRTFLTYGLRQLLGDALLRLSGKGGNPIVDLQTNFGGGKTHSLLALYHLFSGAPISDLVGLESLLQETNLTSPPTARRAVLVGYALAPGKARATSDGCLIHTLWGELAWQLLGREGYELVAEADRYGVSPGSETLSELFRRAEPCLILIDEWVVFARQLYGISGLPAGSFDANLSFAQALTQAAMASPRTLVVATIPSSDGETGGEGGREAATRLKNIFGRVETPWRPADAEEGFEIVRRRIFQPITDPALFTSRDAVARTFANLYQSQPQEFPDGCRDTAYEKRIRDAYPIHPELFDRLYSDWSSLEKFQRTRGVLRLMATVVHTLWQRNDTGPLILPSSIPIDDRSVQNELTRYLEDNWVPIIERDVDGSNSLPRRIDLNNAASPIGKAFASTRVARTIYLGSAPLAHSPHRGLTEQQIKLGSVVPGESIATFGDALRRLSDQAYHLNLDGQRYWYSTQATVTRLANERASQYADEDIYLKLENWLKDNEAKTRGDFARVHVCPASTGDVLDDDRSARLVILKPEYAHGRGDQDSPAVREARNLLDNRDNTRRGYRNTLVFLAADRNRVEELKQGMRQYLAWESICADSVSLNLDPFQNKQAQTQRDSARKTVELRVPQTYHWLLVPEQIDARQPAQFVQLTEVRLQPQAQATPLAPDASRKLRNEELLVTQYAGVLLRGDMDKIPLWRGNHVSIKSLADFFASYPYLKRLKNTEVLLTAIADGLSNPAWQTSTFAYADGYDSEKQRYLNLRTGQSIQVMLDSQSLLVKPEVALLQIAADAEAADQARARARAAAAASYAEQAATSSPVLERSGSAFVEPPAATPLFPEQSVVPTPLNVERLKTRFHGTIKLDPRQPSKQMPTIAAEVLQHLTSLLDCKVEVTLEIHAENAAGFPEDIQRIIKENCATLKFERETDFEEM